MNYPITADETSIISSSKICLLLGYICNHFNVCINVIPISSLLTLLLNVCPINN